MTTVRKAQDAVTNSVYQIQAILPLFLAGTFQLHAWHDPATVAPLFSAPPLPATVVFGVGDSNAQPTWDAELCAGIAQFLGKPKDAAMGGGHGHELLAHWLNALVAQLTPMQRGGGLMSRA
jgi:hypothetical protein